MDAAFVDAYLAILGAYVMGISVVPISMYLENICERSTLRKKIKEEIKKYNTVLSMSKVVTKDLLHNFNKENTHGSQDSN